MTAQLRVRVIACGALARELFDLTRAGGLDHVSVTCLPASLHNRPDKIPAAVRDQIREARADGYDRVVVGYADCGTGGLLDRVCDDEGVERLPGAHCYELYAGSDAFAAMHEREPGTFYLTDYLARHFDRLVVQTLGLDRHPQLRDAYFGNYRRLVYLAQTDDPDLEVAARRAADRLGLDFELRRTGTGGLAAAVSALAGTSRSASAA